MLVRARRGSAVRVGSEKVSMTTNRAERARGPRVAGVSTATWQPCAGLTVGVFNRLSSLSLYALGSSQQQAGRIERSAMKDRHLKI
jgi:hypothetical protein